MKQAERYALLRQRSSTGLSIVVVVKGAVLTELIFLEKRLEC